MPQEIIAIDSQILSSYQSCPKLYDYKFLQNLRTVTISESLEKGGLMHKLLEIAYPMKMKDSLLSLPNRDNFKELIAAGFKIPETINHSVIRNFAMSAAHYYAAKMSLPEDEVNSISNHFKEYWDFYEQDTWNPLAVEEVGSKILYEDEELKIIWTFKVDMVAEQGNIIAPFDHKTSKRRQEPHSVNNQFIGYCFGLNTNHIIINTIGFQKTLSPKERFNRFILTIDDDRIEEWRRNTVFWIRKLRESHILNYFEMNLTSCDKYFGCDFLSICESSPSGRLYKIERNFKVDEAWDPGEKLEKIVT